MSNEGGDAFLLNATAEEFSLVATQKLALEKDHNYSAPNGSMVSDLSIHSSFEQCKMLSLCNKYVVVSCMFPLDYLISLADFAANIC